MPIVKHHIRDSFYAMLGLTSALIWRLRLIYPHPSAIDSESIKPLSVLHSGLKRESGSLFKIHNYFFKNFFFKKNFILCNFLVRMLQ